MNDVGGEACAQKAPIERSSLPRVQGTAKLGEMTLEACANQRCLIGFGEDASNSGVDVVVRNSSGAQLACDPETSLAACMRVVPGIVDRIAGIVEVALLAQARDDGRNVCRGFGAAL